VHAHPPGLAHRNHDDTSLSLPAHRPGAGRFMRRRIFGDSAVGDVGFKDCYPARAIWSASAPGIASGGVIVDRSRVFTNGTEAEGALIGIEW
jgi:hypothetical protein